MQRRSLTFRDEALSRENGKFCEGEVSRPAVSTNIPKAHWQVKTRSVRTDVSSPETNITDKSGSFRARYPLSVPMGKSPNSLLSINHQTQKQ
ncbi:hypothetical protein [Sphingobacterium arenae]|uniref:Uncharacterized protein n=1 Tax=Sphingobacterium arenae TaxID=1280598 RepID=A0ABR7XYC8_9SPHI|nr:hypothetical protein [Sphingobacterium arenae]MBD1424056.1 hypothetical protein [Sphingobacterium arenae]